MTITLIDSEEPEPRQVDGRMAAIIRALLEERERIESSARGGIELHWGGQNVTVKLSEVKDFCVK